VDFQEKTILRQVFWNFVQTMAILYQNLLNLALLSAIFILDTYRAENIHTSIFICFLHAGKEARPLTNHKKKIRGRKARSFFFRNTNFV